MKVLILSELKPKRYSTLIEALGEDWGVDLRLYGECGLRALVSQVDFSAFDRVLFASGVRRAGSSFLALRDLPALHVFDLDLQQDYMPESNYYRLFSPLFKKFRKLHLIVTSLASQQHFERLGFSVSWLPKAYDHRLITNRGAERTINYGFVGRTKNRVYMQRNTLLANITERLPLETLRTEDASESSDDYNQALNQIRYFISADAGFREFHIKNFEAMAAGCVVCAFRTSDDEAAALGFRDMENIVLYNSPSELEAKIALIQDTPGRWQVISDAAARLAQERHQWRQRKNALSDALSCPGQTPPASTLQDFARYAYLRAYHLLSRR